MNRKHRKGLQKHSDFVVVDILCFQIAFILSFWLFHGVENPYKADAYRFQGFLLLICQFLVTAFSSNYSGILRRKRFDEFLAVFRYIATIMLLAILVMFLLHSSARASRLQIGFSSVLFLALDFPARLIIKKRIIRLSSDERGKNPWFFLHPAS